MIASTLLAVETPASKNDLWTPPALFLHDWSSPFLVRTSWPTQLAATASAAEVRSGLALKPMRSVDVVYQAMERRETALLRGWLWRMAAARTIVPLFCDQSPLTAAVAAGASALLCDTSCRRFYAGGRVVVWAGTTGSIAQSFELAVAGTVTAGTLTLTGTLTNGFGAGALVAPVIEADLVPEMSATYVTDRMMELRATFRESVGPMALPAACAVGATPAGAATYDGAVICNLPAHWGAGGNGGGARRLHEASQVGLTTYLEVHGQRPQAYQETQHLMLDRSQAWEALAFFDSRGGRREPFLAVSLTDDYATAGSLTTGATTVALTAVAPLLDWNWRTHLALVLGDESLVVRKIEDVARAGATDTVTLDAALPVMTAGAMRVSSAFFGRFDSDTLEETWTTDATLALRLPAAEVVREGSLTLAHLPAPPVAGGRRASDPAGSSAFIAPDRTVSFFMEDAFGTPIPGAVLAEDPVDVGCFDQVVGAEDYVFDAALLLTGSLVWRSLRDSPVVDASSSLFQVFAGAAGTVTVQGTYTYGYLVKAIFPVVNGARALWSDGSPYNMVSFSPASKQVVLAKGDLLEIGAIMSSDGSYWTHANYSGGADEESVLSLAGDNAASRAVGSQIRTVALSQTQVQYLGTFAVEIYGDAEIAWEFGEPPEGMTITPSSGMGPATVTIETFWEGDFPDGLDQIGFTFHPVVLGVAGTITKSFTWRHY